MYNCFKNLKVLNTVLKYSTCILFSSHSEPPAENEIKHLISAMQIDVCLI